MIEYRDGLLYNGYAIVFADHNSKVTCSYILKSKKAIATIRNFNKLFKQQDRSNCYVRPDNEFNTKELNDYASWVDFAIDNSA